MRWVLFILLLPVWISCSHTVSMVHVGDFEPYQEMQTAKLISSQAMQTEYFGYNLSTEYINHARQLLLAQCPKGQIKGPVTKLTTKNGIRTSTHKVFMQALCVE